LWGLLGGYHLERLPIVDLVCPVGDLEAVIDHLAAIRDVMGAT
jgi:hypothetical protein